MNVLLLSMPDSFEHMPPFGIRMPNGALTSLAGNVDPHHSVAVADLILAQRRIRETVEQLVRNLKPDLVGLSVMTFQRATAKRIVDLLRSLRPDVRIVAGGYDPTLAVDAYTECSSGVIDFVLSPVFQEQGPPDIVAKAKQVWPQIEKAKAAILDGSMKVPFNTAL